MPEKPTYWICGCGTAVDHSLRRCSACAKEQPSRRRLVMALAAMAAIGLLALRPDRAIQPMSPIADQGLNSGVDRWRAVLQAAPNDVAAEEARMQRDIDLGQKFAAGARPYEAEGTVTGISRMAGGAGFSVLLGKVTLLAGVSLSGGVDTLVKPGDPIWPTLLGLKPGDHIDFSGRFATLDTGALVLANSASADFAVAPRYLFRFQTLQAISRQATRQRGSIPK